MARSGAESPPLSAASGRPRPGAAAVGRGRRPRPAGGPKSGVQAGHPSRKAGPKLGPAPAHLEPGSALLRPTSLARAGASSGFIFACALARLPGNTPEAARHTLQPHGCAAKVLCPSSPGTPGVNVITCASGGKGGRMSLFGPAAARERPGAIYSILRLRAHVCRRHLAGPAPQCALRRGPARRCHARLGPTPSPFLAGRGHDDNRHSLRALVGKSGEFFAAPLSSLPAARGATRSVSIRPFGDAPPPARTMLRAARLGRGCRGIRAGNVKRKRRAPNSRANRWSRCRLLSVGPARVTTALARRCYRWHAVPGRR